MTIRRYLKRAQPLALLLIACLALGALGTIVRADQREYTQEDAKIIARAVWGEARSCDANHQTAVVWCILNRVDSALLPNAIRQVVTQKHQFSSYHAGNHVDPVTAERYGIGRWITHTKSKKKFSLNRLARTNFV